MMTMMTTIWEMWWWSAKNSTNDYFKKKNSKEENNDDDVDDDGFLSFWLKTLNLHTNAKKIQPSWTSLLLNMNSQKII